MKIKGFINKIEQSTARYPDSIFSDKGKIYTCVNPFKYHIVRKNFDTYMKMDGIFVDGILMCKMIGLVWRKKIRRLSFDMTAMARDLFSFLDKSGKSVYFIGDAEEAVTKAVYNFSKNYPGMKVSGFRNGFFSSDTERQAAIKEIVKLNPDFTIIGMGGNIQERFAIDLKNAGYNGIAFTCGGFLHQSANTLHYYPAWVDKYNLRVFYRMVTEKTYVRMFHVLISFPLQFIFDSLHSQISRK